MESNWLQFLTGLAGAGVFTAGYKIIELWVKRRNTEAEAARTEAERDKLEAEGDQLRGQTWQEACTWLASSVDKLRGRVTDVEQELVEANDYISELLCGIEKLLRQLRRVGVQQPDWTPPRRPRPPVTGYISSPAGD